MIDNIHVQLIEATQALRKLDKKVYNRALLSALHRVSSKARTAVYKAIKDRYRIKKSEINIRLIKANIKTLATIFMAKYRPLPLTKFFSKQNRKGVVVEILRGNRKLIPGAFIGQPHGRNYSEYGQQKKVVATLPLVLRRESKRPYPLRGFYGPSYGAMLKSPETKNAVNDIINRDFQKLLLHEIEYRLNKIESK